MSAKREDVTVDDIMRLKNEGFYQKDIAILMGCSPDLISRRVRGVTSSKYNVPSYEMTPDRIKMLQKKGWGQRKIAAYFRVAQSTISHTLNQDKNKKKTRRRCSRPGCNNWVPPENRMLCKECSRKNPTTRDNMCVI